MYKLLSRVGFQVFLIAILYTCVTRSDNSDSSSGSSSESYSNEIIETAPKQVLRAVQFYYQSCDDNYNETVYINEIQLANVMSSKYPDLVLSISAEVMYDIEGPVQLDLQVGVMLSGIFIAFPCVDQVGSCTYPDICNMTDSSACPISALDDTGVSCSCPVKEGNMTISDIPFQIPSSIPPGEYILIANVTRGNEVVLCQSAYVKLEYFVFIEQE